MVKVEESEDCGNTSKLTVEDATFKTFEASDLRPLRPGSSCATSDLEALQSKPLCVKHEESLPSSSSSMLKSDLVGMGFSAALVDKVVEENGEGDFNLILDILFTQSAIENSTSEFIGSANGTCDLSEEENDSSFELSSCGSQEIEENKPVGGNFEKKTSLLNMKFSEEDIDLAISHLGLDASLPELIDFIIAAQIAGGAKGNIDTSDHGADVNSEVITTETLFTTMDKTLRLLQMGFTEEEISTVMDNYGSGASVCELADSIFARRLARGRVKDEKDLFTHKDEHRWLNQNASWNLGHATEEQSEQNLSRTQIGEFQASSSNCFPYDSNDMRKIKKAKCMNDKASVYSSGCWEAKATLHHSYAKPEYEENGFYRGKMPERMGHDNRNGRHCSSKPPYFFFGNVIDISPEAWQKLSRFLFETDPEHVNSQYFSAFIRKEGYIHNLPTENRCHILPRPPMTIEDALPHTKRWWPSWDTRKQLSCLTSEITGVACLCERLGRMMTNCQGILSKEQQMDILHQCKTMNLLWVGKNKLRPIEPDQIEYILGYPPQHTGVPALGDTDKRIALKHAFQIDTLGYHLSSLKWLYSDGIRVISIFSGIGGIEIALSRLGIHLRCVISVEASEVNRKILRRWWQTSGQTGELRQIEGTQRLSGDKIGSIIEEFGGIDLVIAGNPSTFGSPGGDSVGVDFPMFFEFVRILQRVKGVMGRS